MEKTQESAALEQRREYYRRWRAAHKDSVRKYNERYWMRKAAKAASAAQEVESSGAD